MVNRILTAKLDNKASLFFNFIKGGDRNVSKCSYVIGDVGVLLPDFPAFGFELSSNVIC